MAYKRVCLNCGKDFTTTDKKVINCSIKCKSEYQFKRTIQRIEIENNIQDLKEWLIQKYSIEKQTFRWIYRELNINNRTVSKLLKYYNIEIRYGSEAIKSQWATAKKRNARRKPNKYVSKEDYAEIKIYRKTKDIWETVLIDLEDVEKCKKYHWTITDGYACYVYIKNKERVSLKLHKFLINVPEGKVVDHKNGNTLDDRKYNLRICTRIQNSWNRKKNSNSASPFKGVHKKGKSFEAYISCNKVKMYLGTFGNLDDAIKARKQAELKYFGEYSYLNRENIL